MASEPDDRRRILVPWEIGSFLRAPYGWTNAQRRAEGWSERGGESRRSIRIGFWRNVILGLALYGPVVAGALLGWWARGRLTSAFLGAAFGFAVQVVVVMLALPIIALMRGRRP